MKTRVIRAGEGQILGSPLGCRDRFLVDSKDWGGNLAVVEHLLAPRAIAAPLHRHTKEDEFSLILEGRVWFVAGDEEHVAEVGDLVFKPRGEWHTFFNAADEPARPAGADTARRPGGGVPHHRHRHHFDLGPVIAPYGCQGDLEATVPLIKKYRLTFG